MGSDGWLDLLNGTSGADAAGPLVKAAGQELDHRIEADPELDADTPKLIANRLNPAELVLVPRTSDPAA